MPILGVTGLPGAGKTFYVVRQLYGLRRSASGRNRAIYTNAAMVLPWGPRVQRVDTLESCFELRDCELFLDELHLLVPARAWKEHAKEVGEFFSQLRKRRVNLWYTTQSLSDVDKLIRERTEMSIWCESFFNFGYFRFTAFFGIPSNEDSRRGRYRRGVYSFNQSIADCYDTSYEVKLR